MKRNEAQDLHNKVQSGEITIQQAWFMARWYSLKPSERQVVILVGKGYRTSAAIMAHTGISQPAIAGALKAACDLGFLTREEAWSSDDTWFYVYRVVTPEYK